LLWNIFFHLLRLTSEKALPNATRISLPAYKGTTKTGDYKNYHNGYWAYGSRFVIDGVLVVPSVHIVGIVTVTVSICFLVHLGVVVPIGEALGFIILVERLISSKLYRIPILVNCCQIVGGFLVLVLVLGICWLGWWNLFSNRISTSFIISSTIILTFLQVVISIALAAFTFQLSWLNAVVVCMNSHSK
jgi:hypothetical protein